MLMTTYEHTVLIVVETIHNLEHWHPSSATVQMQGGEDLVRPALSSSSMHLKSQMD